MAKSLWDILISNDIAYSTNGDLYVSVSEWENIPLITQTAIIASALSFGFEQE